MPARLRIIVVMALAATGLVAANCNAHPTHVSLAEAEWNAQNGSLEIVLRLVAEHLEDAVRKATGNQVARLEQAEAEESIRAYVQSRLVVAVDGDQPAECPMIWVGLEVKTQEAWVYVEFKPPVDWERLMLTNSLLFDVVPKQTNIISVRVDGQTTALLFSPDRPKRTLLRRTQPADRTDN